MINHIYKPKGERIWRWKFRLHSTDGKIQDVSLGTSDKQVAEKTRSERLRENEHERAGLLPSRVIRKAAQRKLTEHRKIFWVICAPKVAPMIISAMWRTIIKR
jgi:hypothetical protein